MIEARIAAGIVTYNPDISKLQQNIKAISEQVEHVYVFDNGSINVSDIKKLCSESASLARSHENLGIAYALNRLFEEAEADGYDWLLTLDQDSVCMPGLISIFGNYLEKADSLTTLRKDINYQINEIEDNTVQEIERCITSGNIVKISIWRKVGGFNERLFIDMVDVDFCFRLREMGGRIIKIGRYGLQHEMGDGTQIRIFGKKVYIGNYSAFRKYYISRNIIYVIRKYHLKHHYYSYKRLLILFLHALLKETDKMNRCASILKGIRDGFKQFEYIDSYWIENS